MGVKMYNHLLEENGWFENNFNVHQKVNNNVYCYIQRMFGFYTLQLYMRGDTGYCTLEARSENLQKLIALGESWLETYQNSDREQLQQDPYHIDSEQWKQYWSGENKTLVYL
jgi:hypothetical protein